MNRRLVMAACLCACAVVARADCLEGMRPATEAEKQFHVSTLNAMKALFPAAPAGWRLTDSNRIVEPSTVCVGQEKHAASLRYEATYFSQAVAKAASERSAEQARRYREVADLPVDQEKQCADLEKHSRDAQRLASKALAAGNKAEADRLKLESDDLYRQSNAIREAHRKAVAEQLTAMSRENAARRDTTKADVRVEIAVNWISADVFGEPTQPARANSPLAVRAGEKTMLAFGPWKVTKKGAGASTRTEYTSTFGAAVPPTRVQTVLVRFSGSPQQVDEIAGAFQGSAIGALISK